MQINKKLVEIKDYLIYGSGQVINLIAPLLVAPRIIKISGLDNWGKIGIALSIFSLISIIIDFGSLVIGVREISINKDDQSKVSNYLNKTYSLRLLVLILLFILFFPIISFTNLDKQIYYLGFFFLIAQSINPIWFYQGEQNFTTINKIIFFSKGAYIVIVYIFLTNYNSYKFLIFILGLCNSVVYFYFFNKLRKKYNINVFKIQKKEIKEMVFKEYHILISNLSISFYINIPIVIVGHLLNNYYAGIYKIGEMLLSIFRSYLSVFFNVSFPKFCKSYALNKSKGFKFLIATNVFNILFVCFSVVFIYLVYFNFSTILNLTPKINNALKFGINFLPISIIVALNIPFNQMLMYKNKIKAFSIITFISAILMFFICWFFTKTMKIEGSLLSVYVCETIVTSSIIVYYFIFIKRPV